MIFGNLHGFLKEDESVEWMLARLLKSAHENGLKYLEDC